MQKACFQYLGRQVDPKNDNFSLTDQYARPCADDEFFPNFADFRTPISLAGAESVIGLSILIAYYRLKGNISLKTD